MKRFAFIAAAAATGAFAASAGEMVAFADIDTDADGQVTEAEFTAYKTADGEVTEAEAAEKFAKIDADYDGVVTEAELTAAVEAWKAEKDDAEVDVEIDTESDSGY